MSKKNRSSSEKIKLIVLENSHFGLLQNGKQFDLPDCSEVKSVICENIDVKLITPRTVNALHSLLARMPKLESFSLRFSGDNLKILENIDMAMQNLIGICLSECATLKSLELQRCFIQAWNNTTWEAFSHYILKSKIANLSVHSHLCINVLKDHLVLQKLFESSTTVQAFELQLDHFCEDNLERFCEIVGENTHVSQLVLHLSNNSCDVNKLCQDLLSIKHVNIVRIFENGKEVTPEEVLAKIKSKLEANLSLLTEGKEKTELFGSEHEIEQYLSSICNPYSSANLLPYQIQVAMTLCKKLDDLSREDSQYVYNLVADLIDWIGRGLVINASELEFLDLQKWPTTFGLYLDLLAVVSRSMEIAQVRERWGLAIQEKIEKNLKGLLSGLQDFEETMPEDFRSAVRELGDSLGKRFLQELLGDDKYLEIMTTYTELLPKGVNEDEDCFSLDGGFGQEGDGGEVSEGTLAAIAALDTGFVEVLGDDGELENLEGEISSSEDAEEDEERQEGPKGFTNYKTPSPGTAASQLRSRENSIGEDSVEEESNSYLNSDEFGCG